MDLLQKSAEIILANQAATGAYLASPAFPAYQYAWFRDGAFAAHAMDLLGDHGSARRFHDWAAGTVARHTRKAAVGEGPILCARYTAAGEEVNLPWGEYQLDGYGIWLWSLARHLHLAGPGHPPGPGALPGDWRPAVDAVTDYLLARWRGPCFDCWEEYGDRVHPSTLAAVHGGLAAVRPYLRRPDVDGVLPGIRAFLLESRTAAGHFPKFLGTDDVDASLLWLATPFDVLAPDDPAMAATLERIVADLQGEAGLHRYPWDAYYGGGLWLPTAGFFGWHLARQGRRREAEAVLRWLAAQAAPDGALPEQVPHRLRVPDAYKEWQARSGPVASPLLWSHAMYIILHTALAAPGQPG